ncbi:EamA family transporter RarD [Staphylococcus delphini]|uniref:Chloramphenicol-sensitivity protein RarD n=3 Tax=Staphylococcus intermedius group TaxID=2815305 RepID=A0A2A4H0W6_9STAP|nr:EamA family transporter RarD [Staphylococcus delphini]PCF57243.1 chloramphenicol-sensitivity protein RarD [Staphylococcus delphini]PCF62625.1 chloramphenicol-sensitivity protein RarD [Staphylococcus delphini]PCF75553.1 chloramphenicol-sensitivity protein RarD [Staphylococcus delphini]UXS20593.1 EamA family transporter RarD [Staphylococcus delphini]UXS56598.1 EamA family transporter RarD [Staphylococcus delphini]
MYQDKEFKKGILFALLAYVMWGTLPLYWALIHDVDPIETLMYRIVLSLIFMLILLPIIGRWQQFAQDMAQLKAKPFKLLIIILAGYIVTVNWGTFIYAIDAGFVLQTSLGYYINPLVSILLSMIFFKERFNRLEWVAILFAVLGVVYMTFKVGEFPYISLILAFSFGIYGLLKKLVPMPALSSITIESLATAPMAIIYLIIVGQTADLSIGWNMSTFWLLFSGAVTALPLLSFSEGAIRIPLSLMGFIQYVGPTLIFILGIFVFKEPFNIDQFITFCFIWVGIVIYVISQIIKIKKRPQPLQYQN